VSQNINTPAGRNTTHRQSHPLIGHSQPSARFVPSETAALFTDTATLLHRFDAASRDEFSKLDCAESSG